ncbi:MAG TPA: SRPBCC family protein, partial [Candidatus Binatia bacterium]|nr:SRPBCC family protein [Candidatus Binatia bacterium]
MTSPRMPPLLRSRTLSVSIDCSPARVYAFVRNVENLPRWAGGLASAVRKGPGGWILETPGGPLDFAFV